MGLIQFFSFFKSTNASSTLRDKGEAKEKRKRGRKKKEDVEGSEAKEVKEEEKKEKGMKRKGERTSLRERKAVDRYSVTGSPRSGSGKKGISIVQGSGTKLKDIPNVSFKWSKRKADETLHTLHVLLFGRRSSAFHLKRNIIQFSGFVWTDDKKKMRLKEKIDKFSKDKLCEFCELLDIPISKASKKRRKKSEKQAAEPEQEDVNEESDNEESDSEGEVRPSDSEEEPEEDHITGKDKKEDKESKKGQEVEEEEEDKEETKGKEKKKEKDEDKKVNAEEKEGRKKKGKKEEAAAKPKKEEKKGAKTSTSNVDKEKKKPAAKKRGKENVSEEVKSPTKEELHAVISELLKKVDFNMVTRADILRQIGAQFEVDLMDRKAEVKQIIDDVINSMYEEDDEPKEK